MERYKRILITGDIHGDTVELLYRLNDFCPTKNDLVILLGDTALEYYSFYTDGLSEKDILRQKFLKENLPCDILCIQGNHEVPFKEMHGDLINKFDAQVIESNGIYFAPNGSCLKINDKKVLVIGGAQSVDKDFRTMCNHPYFANEELTKEEMKKIYDNVNGRDFDFVLTHTCPVSMMPKEALFKKLDQSKIENRTEKFLEIVKESITFKKWYCGHFHIDKNIENFSFLFHSVETINLAQEKFQR